MNKVNFPFLLCIIIIIIIKTNKTSIGGVHFRNIIGLRVEEWPQDLIEAMHKHYTEISELETKQLAKFSIFFGPFSGYNNFATNFLIKPLQFFAEKGNCSYWTSKGMVSSSILQPVFVVDTFFYNSLKGASKSIQKINNVAQISLC